MALQKIIQTEGKTFIHTPFGVIEKESQSITFLAYIKVMFISGDKTQIVANVNFKNDTFELNKQYELPISIEENAPNFIKQVYQHLKTLPEFADAVDC